MDPLGFVVEAESKFDIGARNAASIETQISSSGIQRIASDTGGNQGRSVTFCVETGVVKVCAKGQSELELCTLKA